MQIQGRAIGPDEPMYVVAELSGNHHHDIEVAKKMVQAAAHAGADAIKLQTYTADTITIRSDAPQFRVGDGTLWAGRTLHDLYDEAHRRWVSQHALFEAERRCKIQCFSTPFDTTAVDLLEDLGAPAYKIASFEAVDLELIAHVAATGKPLIISTGMCTADEIADAIDAARSAGCTQLALLRCNSSYPAPPDEMDLRTIPDMRERFGVPVGLSDHTLGPEAAFAARSLGACILEKHIAMSRDGPGPDTAFSMEPDELRAMVQGIRRIEAMLGQVRYGPTQHERNSLAFRRSLFVVEDVAMGDELTRENVRSIRPGHGLAPKYLPDVLGRRAARRIERGTPLAWDLVG